MIFNRWTDRPPLRSTLFILIIVQESVDIAGLVDEALTARRGAERVGVMPAVEQLPIFGITREALLALRYKSRSGEVSYLWTQTSAARRQLTALTRLAASNSASNRRRIVAKSSALSSAAAWSFKSNVLKPADRAPRDHQLRVRRATDPSQGMRAHPILSP